MKRILLCLIFSIPFIVFGQNWQPVNPHWSPQFSLNGEENIDFSIKIDSAVISGEDIWYYLHPTYSNCQTCESPISECTTVEDLLYLKQIPLFGDSILLNEDTYSFFGINLVLKPNIFPGESYNFTLNGGLELTATCLNNSEMEVFGVLDSLKMFSFSDGRSLILSKNYGIVNYTGLSGNTQSILGIP